MQRIRALGLALLGVWLCGSPPAFGVGEWQLPQEITDSNTKVSFEVDSTWHLVEGKTAGLHGRIWLENSADPLSVRIEAAIPVGRFDTDSKSRDEKLRKVMHAARYPEVIFRGRELTAREPGCNPAQIALGAGCKFEIGGELVIGAVSREVLLPIVAERTPEGFAVSGELEIEWADYGVEDPSILIAQLEPTVRIKVGVKLREISAQNQGS
ncbi:MAG: hypothetical protein RL417_1267 [Pseudomonadota bacterium]|jgi:polyisoprenoid-binding protein YceI